jgi:hypothetical protein
MTVKQNYFCTEIMYLYLTCSISYGVNLYLDLQNVNKFNSIQLLDATISSSSISEKSAWHEEFIIWI